MRPAAGPGVGRVGVQSSLDSLSTGGRTLLALARHDARRAYAGTWAGWAWALLTPLVPFLVLAVIFSVGLRLPLGGAPYVYGFAAAYVPWTLLAGAITAAAGSIVELRFLVKRARFPVALIPSAPSLTHTIPHVVLLALTGIACFAGGYGGPALVTLPYFYVCAIVLALGVGLCLSATAVIVRDVTRAVPVAFQLWFWLTPVAWTPARLPAYGRRLLDFNPAAYVVDGYRHALMPRAFPAPTLVQSAIFWLVAVAVLAGGAYWFKRLRPQFWECL